MQSDRMADSANFTLRDEIKAYWSERAATFDQSPGHEIFSEEERAAWHALIGRHLGRGDGRKALDLASGTGVISHLMDDLGYQVTGIDWSEAMLERARAKAASRGRAIRFHVGDAENTLEADDSYDVIITRHLVWTLVDPEACFAEWLRVLHSVGLLHASFRPTAAIVTLRTYMRHRHTLVELAVMHVQRMQKALVQMNLQLPFVISDITGQTGLQIQRRR